LAQAVLAQEFGALYLPCGFGRSCRAAPLSPGMVTSRQTSTLADAGQYIVKRTFIELVDDRAPCGLQALLRSRAHSDPILYKPHEDSSPEAGAQFGEDVSGDIEFDLTGLSDVDTDDEADKPLPLPCSGHSGESTPHSEDSTSLDMALGGTRLNRSSSDAASSATSSSNAHTGELVCGDDGLAGDAEEASTGHTSSGSSVDGSQAGNGSWQDVAALLRENARLALENKLLRENAQLASENASLQATMPDVGDTKSTFTESMAVGGVAVVAAPWMEGAAMVQPHPSQCVAPGVWHASPGYETCPHMMICAAGPSASGDGWGFSDMEYGFDSQWHGELAGDGQPQWQQNQQQGIRRTQREAGAKKTTKAKEVPLVSVEERTTVMLRNLPNNYTRDMLLAMLDAEGFAGKYDFIYLPIDFKTQACLGYAFVNLVTPDLVESFWAAFDGFSKWVLPSKKVCAVTWSGPHQGRGAHVERYRNSPVMHPMVPEVCKPLVFKDGQRAPFPPPTKAPSAPRTRRHNHPGASGGGRGWPQQPSQ